MTLYTKGSNEDHYSRITKLIFNFLIYITICPTIRGTKLMLVGKVCVKGISLLTNTQSGDTIYMIQITLVPFWWKRSFYSERTQKMFFCILSEWKALIVFMTVSAFLFRNKYHVTYKFYKIKRRIVNNKEKIRRQRIFENGGWRWIDMLFDIVRY